MNEELIIIKDGCAVRRSTISRMVWQNHDTLEITFNCPARTPKYSRSWVRTGNTALNFWEQFTGQRVSWDDRPVD